jgi:hypothetical protein
MVAMKSRSLPNGAAKPDAAPNATNATEQSERAPDSTTPESLQGMKSTSRFFFFFFFAKPFERCVFSSADCS